MRDMADFIIIIERKVEERYVVRDQPHGYAAAMVAQQRISAGEDADDVVEVSRTVRRPAKLDGGTPEAEEPDEPDTPAAPVAKTSK